ncbi:MAG: hypothetical protein J5J06_13395 [Phycisphaerae bacterium]|nr:hypothetical protein [Phycisphaerae bacterium]
MADAASQFDAILAVLESVGVDVREEHLGGSGGGLCKLRGRSVVFVDLDADLLTRTDRCIQALAELPDVDAHFLPPAIRDRVDALRESRDFS